jgi:coenzyme F420-reducing hydrogenase alpha subunit
MITNEFIAKIEGHGNLRIDWKKNKVVLEVAEGERLFEGLLVGRKAEDAYWVTPRICGVCPIAHNLASLAALEKAAQIKLERPIQLLRDLMQCAQMIQSHSLHLFFLSLPDYLGIDRGTELRKKNPKAFQYALELKELADNMASISAGRNVHPTTPTIGGFNKLPTKTELKKLLQQLEKTKEAAEWLPKFCQSLDYPELSVDLELVAIRNQKIYSSKNDVVDVDDYKSAIEEEIREFSTAKFSKFLGREVMVGALARLYFENKNYPLDFKNPFHNNLAQAIEVSLYHQKAMEIIKELLEVDLKNFDKKPEIKWDKESKGIGAVEAPRGGLYHEIHVDENGIITYINIITPTVQNLTSIEKTAQALIEKYAHKPQKEKERLLNMLVRAYDPCITCSVH